MKILAIDSSSMVASVAIADEKITIAEYTINSKKTHSQTLLPMIEDMFEKSEIPKSEIDYIAVAGGPGSFTGLRIGCATAKGLGLAWDKPLVKIPTMDAIAYGVFGVEGVVCSMMDARREQVYAGLYRFVDNEMQTIMEQKPVEVRELIEQLNAMGEKVTFAGDGIEVYESIIKEAVTTDYVFAPTHTNRNRAAALAALAVKYIEKNKVISAAELVPDYLRVSQAERERNEKIKSQA
ncbi:MAG: tRNA (adenosine(37)-N6)-threonylcarbamoyltransferase complex dimerization subunit type 1 TsaB [Lachnospiraceae bacterium]|nr:tRNA (adenosine(37)-N6)-threonylcarbamoyltransferase complex dimerization subunit type 1 TsaB [Lachnospiraceae bacterium]